MIPHKFAAALLQWYDQHQRQLPWRSKAPNAYHVWLSEVMLQQTTVKTVIPYFLNFIRLWPTFEDLSKASLEEIFHAWQGLGYYSRARNLYACAQKVTANFEGLLPQDHNALLSLPGIGPYTAAAISSIAFDTPMPVMDGNIERVMSRLYCIETPLPQGKKELYEKAAGLTPTSRSGDYAQALMDLGSGICTPKSPQCGLCPISTFCEAYRRGNPESYPKRIKKKALPRLFGTVLWIEDKEARVMIRKRPDKGLLAGLMEFPGTAWETSPPPPSELLKDFHITEFQLLSEKVRHTFTHFHLELRVLRCTPSPETLSRGLTCAKGDFSKHAFPTLMKKVIQACMQSANAPLPKDPLIPSRTN